MHYINDLPESTASGYTGILVIVDRLTKMAIYLPCQKDNDLPEWAKLVFDHVICKRGVPENIVTDRGTQYTGRFWTQVCLHLSTEHQLSTDFNPQMDGQRQRPTLATVEYIQGFCNYEQDNLVEPLLQAEFAYNNAIYVSTRMTPFWVNYHYNPVMQCKAPQQLYRLILEIQADTFAVGWEETRQTLCKILQEAQANQTKYASGIEVVFDGADKVWFSTRHFRMTRPSKKLDY
jgi:hypothetical protein